MEYITLSFRDGMLVEQVAETLRIHPESVRRLGRQGKLHPVKIANTMLFDRAEIEAFREVYNPQKGSGKISVTVIKGGDSSG